MSCGMRDAQRKFRPCRYGLGLVNGDLCRSWALTDHTICAGHLHGKSFAQTSDSGVAGVFTWHFAMSRAAKMGVPAWLGARYAGHRLALRKT